MYSVKLKVTCLSFDFLENRVPSCRDSFTNRSHRLKGGLVWSSGERIPPSTWHVIYLVAENNHTQHRVNAHDTCATPTVHTASARLTLQETGGADRPVKYAWTKMVVRFYGPPVALELFLHPSFVYSYDVLCSYVRVTLTLGLSRKNATLTLVVSAMLTTRRAFNGVFGRSCVFYIAWQGRTGSGFRAPVGATWMWLHVRITALQAREYVRICFGNRQALNELVWLVLIFFALLQLSLFRFMPSHGDAAFPVCGENFKKNVTLHSERSGVEKTVIFSNCYP